MDLSSVESSRSSLHSTSGDTISPQFNHLTNFKRISLSELSAAPFDSLHTCSVSEANGNLSAAQLSRRGVSSPIMANC